MNKKESLKKINILIDELKLLKYYDDIIDNEYMKWNEKSYRFLNQIFNENSEQTYKYAGIIFECYNSYSDCIPSKTFNDAKKAMNSLLEIFIEEIEELDEKTQIYKDKSMEIDKSKVFIVHGHDEGLKYEVAHFIGKLNLEAIILEEQANNGMSIFEKIERYSNVGFAIILYTACDIGGKDKESLQSRARQNVIFEHGYLCGKIGRENISFLKKGDIEIANDLSGLVYIEKSDNWKMELVKNMKASGYDIDMENIL